MRPDDDEMRGDDVAGRGDVGLALFRGEPSGQAPGCGEFRLEEHASDQPDHPQHIGKRVQRSFLPGPGGLEFRA